MDIKKYLPKRPIFRVIALLAIILLVFTLYNVLVKSEDPGTIITTPVHYPADSQGENTSYTIWTKVVKTTTGIFPLKSDSYNAMSLSVYTHGYWSNIAYERGWSVPVQIAGFGATRSGYGLLTANGLKTITLRSEESLDVHSFVGMNLHGEEDYLALMLSTATGSLQDKKWPRYSPEDVLDSAHKPIMHNPDYQYDTARNRFSSTLNKWQYSDLSGGDKSDAVYAVDTYSVCSPGGSEEISYTSIFSWGLLGSSRNEITLRMHLPPDPTTLTQDQLDRYHISVTTVSSGEKLYVLDQLDCEVY